MIKVVRIRTPNPDSGF